MMDLPAVRVCLACLRRAVRWCVHALDELRWEAMGRLGFGLWALGKYLAYLRAAYRHVLRRDDSVLKTGHNGGR